MKLKTKHLFQLTLLCMVLVGVFLIPQKTYAKDSDFVIENGVLKEYKGHSKNVVIPNGVTTIDMNIFGDTDQDSKFIETITIPSSVKKLNSGDGFAYCFNTFWCPNLKKIIVSKDNKYFSSVNGVLYNKKKTTLIRYPRGQHKMVSIPKTVITVSDGAFSMCHIKNFKIPKTIKKIGKGGFAYITDDKLINLVIPNSVKSIGEGAFYWSGIKSVVISNKMKKIPDYAFADCGDLKTVTIPKSVKKIGYGIFQTHEKNVTIKGYKGSYAQSYAKKNNIKFKEIKK